MKETPNGIKRRRSICLFGTSADPPTSHGGHLGIVTHLVSSQFNFDQVWIVPVYRHMFRNKRGKQASYDHRLAMCDLTFGDVEKAVVSRVERDCFDYKLASTKLVDHASIRVGTADVLEYLRRKEPDVDLTFAMGSDTFRDFLAGKWARDTYIASLVQNRFLVIQRSMLDPVPQTTSATMTEDEEGGPKDSNRDEEKLERSHSEVVSPFPEEGPVSLALEIVAKKATFVQVPSLTVISSTLVRSTKNAEQLRQWVVPSVLKYIVDHGMYAFEESEEEGKEDEA